MSKSVRFSVVFSFIWFLTTTIVLFNIVYVDRPYMGGEFWMVFLRSVAVVSVIPLFLLWGIWWARRGK